MKCGHLYKDSWNEQHGKCSELKYSSLLIILLEYHLSQVETSLHFFFCVIRKQGLEKLSDFLKVAQLDHLKRSFH